MTAEIPFSRLGIDPNQIVDSHEDSDTPDYLWEGPRFVFHVFLGIGATWGRDGMPGLWSWSESAGWVCGACCRYGKLSPSMYCTHCDRSGRDAQIPPPSALDFARRKETRKYTPPDHLAGGTGGPLAGRVRGRQAG